LRASNAAFGPLAPPSGAVFAPGSLRAGLLTGVRRDGIRSEGLVAPLGAGIALAVAIEGSFFNGRAAGVVDVDEAVRRGKREVLVGMPDGRGIADEGASIGARQSTLALAWAAAYSVPDGEVF